MTNKNILIGFIHEFAVENIMLKGVRIMYDSLLMGNEI